MKDEDLDNFVILNSRLLYIGENDIEKEAAAIARIETSNGAVREVKSIISEVVNLGNEYSLPANDTVGSSEENRNSNSRISRKKII